MATKTNATKKNATKKPAKLQEAEKPREFSGGHSASDLIFDDVCELEGMLDTLVRGHAGGAEEHLYYMFRALSRPVERLKEAIEYMDEHDYCEPPSADENPAAKEKRAKNQAA